LTDKRRAGGVAGMPSKILFVKFAEQGSTVLAYRAIERAIKMVGSGNVYFLVFKENRFILDVMNLIPRENVITIRHKNLVDAGLQALFALYKIRRPGVFRTFIRCADLFDRREIARGISHVFRRRSLSRKSHDPPIAL
jgi:hypothetical protein